ncbi:hypothetical protein L204_101002 [Cryptococcus depauperatus]|nr:hypothetical protein L204_01068 [Cryptococcus depauperatus CBS 7855]
MFLRQSIVKSRACLRPSAAVARAAPFFRSLNTEPQQSSSEFESLADPTTTFVKTKSGAEARESWYYIARSSSGELPVYSKYRHGSQVTTIIRKVEGDANVLKHQLDQFFKQSHIDPFSSIPKITVRPTNKHIQIKGHWVEEVKEFLEEEGL